MWRWIAVVCVIGCRPLGPGETRCSSTPLFGTTFTECKSGPPQTQEVVVRSEPAVYRPEPAPRRASEGVNPPMAARNPTRWWCVTYASDQLGSGQVGMCFADRGSCETRRSSAIAMGAAVSYCEPRSAASCFGVAVQTGIFDSCHQTFRACVEQRDYVLTNPEQATALSDCRTVE